MQKIVIDARESGTTTGRYVDKLIEYLYRLKPNYQIVILAKAHRLDFMRQLAPGFEVIESPFKEFTFAEQLGFKKQIKSLKPDLVFFPAVQQPVFYRGKVVTMIQDLTTVRFNNPSKNWFVFKFKQMVYRWVNKRVAKRSKLLLAPSEFTKNDIVQFARIDPNKVIVTYEAGDRIVDRPEVLLPLKDKSYIMYVGRPMPHKNLERLIKAFVIIRQTHPNLMLVLVGKLDDNYKVLQKMVERKKIEGVFFTDFVTEGELRWLYENTRAYVFPSLSEGFGLPPLEAMCHSAPIVSSNATCLPEVNGNAAHYFNPLDINDMAKAVNEVLDDQRLARNLVIEGSLQVKKYSWQRMAEQTLAVFEKVIKNPSNQ